MRRIGCYSLVITFFLSINFVYASDSPGIPETKGPQAEAGAAEIDNLLKVKVDREMPPIYEGVVAVQNRAKKKSSSFLFYPYYSMDFSDTPYSLWAPNLSLGWAVGEFIEVYFNFASGFANTERYLAKKIKTYTLDGGGHPEMDIEKAKSQMGFELIWTPIYGKDSWGPYRIIRSDMFFELAAYSIQFQTKPGLRLKTGIGKTFYIYDYLNIRLTAALSNIQYATSTGFTSSLVGFGDMGLVFYF